MTHDQSYPEHAALRQLVAKLEEIHEHPRFKVVWQISQMHIGPYDGPTYTEELAAAKAALASHPGADAQGSGDCGTWQPIETAPKDGTLLLLFCDHRDGDPEWYVGHYVLPTGLPGPFGPYVWKVEEGGSLLAERSVTHWQPLTSPKALSLSSTEGK